MKRCALVRATPVARRRASWTSWPRRRGISACTQAGSRARRLRERTCSCGRRSCAPSRLRASVASAGERRRLSARPARRERAPPPTAAHLVQVHTYAAASSRALLTATAVLDALPSPTTTSIARAPPSMTRRRRRRRRREPACSRRGRGSSAARSSPGLPLDAKARAAAVGVLRRRCHDDGLLLAMVFLLTPPYDADVDDVRVGCERRDGRWRDGSFSRGVLNASARSLQIWLRA